MTDTPATPKQPSDRTLTRLQRDLATLREERNREADKAASIGQRIMNRGRSILSEWIFEATLERVERLQGARKALRKRIFYRASKKSVDKAGDG